MSDATQREHDRIKTVTRLLHEGCRPLRVLSALAWPPEVKADFLARGGRILPEVSYAPFDPAPTIEAVREARCLIVPVTTIDLWLERQAQSIEQAARMLAAVGTSGFFEHGRLLYGEPTAPLRYLCRAPRFLPPWISDPRHLLAMLTFTVFANRLGIELLVAVVAKLLDSAPVVRMPSAA